MPKPSVTRRRRRWWAKILTLSSVSLLWAGCQHPNPYLRDLHPDPQDPNRVSIEREYLKALLTDLEACYRDKSP